MESFKIEHFRRDNGQSAVLRYQRLSDPEAAELASKLRERLELSRETTSIDLLNHLQLRSSALPGVNADSDEFELDRVFKQLRLPLSANTYVNWSHFDDVDEVNTADLLKWFDYLWYPGADDVDLMPENIEWVLSVQHSGAVRFLDLRTPGASRLP